MKIPHTSWASTAIILWTAGSLQAALVTFQVDMSAQIALGNFNPAADSVFVAGDPLNGWSTSDSQLSQSPTNTSLWVGTFDVSANAGSTVQYKFLMSKSNGLTWEGNVGPGGATGNRTFVLAAADQTLPVVFFNNVTSSTTVSPNVTFQVDMSVQSSSGNFDPASGTVAVAGDFNGWSTSAFPLTNSAANSSLWTGTVKLTGAANSAVLYKFVMNGGTWEGDVGENGAQNRSLTLKSGDLILPVAYFNNVAALSNLGALSTSTVSGGRITLSWTGGPLIRLQQTPDLINGPWQDVPNTEGQSSATVDVGPTAAFFRLTGS